MTEGPNILSIIPASVLTRLRVSFWLSGGGPPPPPPPPLGPGYPP